MRELRLLPPPFPPHRVVIPHHDFNEAGILWLASGRRSPASIPSESATESAADDTEMPSQKPSLKASKLRAGSSPSSNYSDDVKRKLQASNRTGQACDRCRIRKMRCDDMPDGCAPCMQNHSACQTTDRNTGEAVVRGHVKRLQHRIQELEDRLVSVGVDIKQSDRYADPSTAPLLQWSADQGNTNHQIWENHGRDMNSAHSRSPQYGTNRHGSLGDLLPDTSATRLPQFRGGLAGNNYLGVSSGNSFVSSIRGTSLNVLGVEIDLADYMSADLDEPEPSAFLTKPVYNKSYHAFVHTAFSGKSNIERPELPPRNEGLTYAQWYFRVINPYLPLLHKPTFMSTLTNFYDNQDGNKGIASVADTVMVHMLFAIMFFQYASRNWENAAQQSELNEVSNRHYHYALSFFPQLVASHTLQDIQALTLICIHLRSFPKPGACWMMTTTTFNLAIDLGLHRSARQWASMTPKRSLLEIEMRKRIFWSILTIHIVISGKLGRPMALQPDDFDVEIPEALDDTLLDENGLNNSRQGRCGFLVGIEIFNCQLIFMDLYNNIYAIRRTPRTYIESVRRLDSKIIQWSEQWPSQLLPNSASKDEEGRVQSHYMGVSLQEFRLLLHHPSLSLTQSEEFNSENLRICLDASQKMLQHVKQIQKYRSLDTNWQTGALYVLAISTTLFGHYENKEDMTAAGYASLREDMDSWLSIMGDVGGLLGSGKKLQEALRVTVEGTLGFLATHLATKTVPPALSGPPNHIASPIPSLTDSHTPKSVICSVPKGSSDNFDLKAEANGWESPDHISAHTQYPDPSAYSYPEPSRRILAPYNPSPTSFQVSSSIPAAFSASYSQLPSSPQAIATAATTYLYSNPPQAPSVYQSINSAYSSMPTYSGVGGPTSWRHWAGNMTSSLEPQEYMSSANALMQLGGRSDQGASQGPGVPVPTTVPAQVVTSLQGSGGMTTGQPWPLMIFDGGLSPHP